MSTHSTLNQANIATEFYIQVIHYLTSHKNHQNHIN